MTLKQRVALIAIILGSGVIFLDGTVVNVALPNMATELHASFAGQQWVMLGYLLSLSALLLLGGSLGDIFGRKRMYTLGLVGFAVASMMCAIAPSIAVVIFFRILQGAFSALVVPGALAIINTNFSGKLRPKALGMWVGGTSAIGAAGPFMGGLLIHHFSWRAIFVVEVPLLVLCAVLAKLSIVESKDKKLRRLDFTGAGLAMLSLLAVIYSLVSGSAKGWKPQAVVMLMTGLLLMAAFIKHESRTKDPMVNLKLFKSRDFSSVNLITFLLYGCLNGFFFIFIVNLQTVVGFSSIKTGLVTIPVALLIVLFSSRFGKLASTHGPRLFMTVGPILIGLATFSMLQIHSGSTFMRDLLPRLLLLGLGLAINVVPLTDTVLGSVKKQYSGVASAINNTVARTSGLIVIALLGLFGTDNAYEFGGFLCGSLAILSGVLSFVLIRKKQHLRDGPSAPVSEQFGI